MTDRSPADIAKSLKITRREALLSGVEYGNYSSATRDDLIEQGLITRNMQLTELGADVLDEIQKVKRWPK